MKIRFFLIVFLAFLLCNAIAYSQIRIGAKAGANFSQFSADNGSFDYKNLKPGFHAGVAIDFTLIPFFLSLQPQVLYSQKGNIDKNDNYTRLNYFEVPVNLKFSIPAIPIYILAGPYGGYCYNGYFEESSIKTDIDFTNDNLKNYDFGYNIGMGYYKNFKVIRFFVEALYGNGIINLNDQGNKNMNLSISTGLLIGL